MWEPLEVWVSNQIGIRWYSVCAFSGHTLVFPLPGPANICNGIFGSCSTAINQSKRAAYIVGSLKIPFRWAGFNPLIKDTLSIFGKDMSPDLELLVFICVYRVEYTPFVWFWLEWDDGHKCDALRYVASRQRYVVWQSDKDHKTWSQPLQSSSRITS